MGRIVALHLYAAEKAEACSVSEALAVVGHGLDGDRARGETRQVTVLGLERWRDALAVAGVAAPPETRRANVVVEGIELSALVGRRLRLGDVVLEVLGETAPCKRMDELVPGLRAALEPEWRGGVHGRILVGGRMSVGDSAEPVER